MKKCCFLYLCTHLYTCSVINKWTFLFCIMCYWCYSIRLILFYSRELPIYCTASWEDRQSFTLEPVRSSAHLHPSLGRGERVRKKCYCRQVPSVGQKSDGMKDARGSPRHFLLFVSHIYCEIFTGSGFHVKRDVIEMRVN